MTFSGAGAKEPIQWVVTTSLKSLTWSECRWVSRTAVTWPMPAPAAASRMSTPRPVSTRNRWPPASTRFAAPARSADGNGHPVPNVVIFMPGSLAGQTPSMSQTVEAVLWDVGGVFLPSPFSHVRSLGAEIGIDGDELLELVFGPYHEDTDHPWHRLERGQVSFEDCNAELIALAAESGHDVDPMAVLMRMGGDGASIVREDVVAVAVAAKAGGRASAIITNNIAEFAQGWRGLFADLDAMADVIIDSSAVGLRKPDPAIFHLALDQLGGIAPERAVFLDDAPGNVAAARAVGIQAILVADDYAPALAELEALLGS